VIEELKADPIETNRAVMSSDPPVDNTVDRTTRPAEGGRCAGATSILKGLRARRTVD
jgi:hypothetical protein